MIDRQDTRGLLAGLCARDRHNARKLGRWTVAWGISTVVAAVFFGPSHAGVASISPWFYAFLAVPLAAGGLMIRAYLDFLSDADELVKLILLRAAASGFGVVFALGIVFYLTSQIFGQWEDEGAITWAAGFLTYEISLIGQWKKLDVQPPA